MLTDQVVRSVTAEVLWYWILYQPPAKAVPFELVVGTTVDSWSWRSLNFELLEKPAGGLMVPFTSSWVALLPEYELKPFPLSVVCQSKVA